MPVNDMFSCHNRRSKVMQVIRAIVADVVLHVVHVHVPERKALW
jgi:hypothetical protein